MEALEHHKSDSELKAPRMPEPGWLNHFGAHLKEIADGSSGDIGTAGRSASTTQTFKGDPAAAELFQVFSRPGALEEAGRWIWQYLNDPSANDLRHFRGKTVTRSLQRTIAALKVAAKVYEEAIRTCTPLTGPQMFPCEELPEQLRQESNRLRQLQERSAVAFSTKRLGRDRNMLPLYILQEFAKLLCPDHGRLNAKQLALLIRVGEEISGNSTESALQDPENIEKNLKHLQKHDKNTHAIRLAEHYAAVWFNHLYGSSALSSKPPKQNQ